jgi:anti-anti-sigma factor
MHDAGEDAAVSSSTSGQIAVIYAGDYLNKLSGERIERECRKRLDSGCRGLLINFRDTELVNSIGVSILLGVIDAAGSVGARLAFSDVNDHTVQLFNMLGLTRHVSLLEDEASALSVISREISQGVES